MVRASLSLLWAAKAFGTTDFPGDTDWHGLGSGANSLPRSAICGIGEICG